MTNMRKKRYIKFYTIFIIFESALIQVTLVGFSTVFELSNYYNSYITTNINYFLKYHLIRFTKTVSTFNYLQQPR